MGAARRWETMMQWEEEENRVLTLALSQTCFMTWDKTLCLSASQMLGVGIRGKCCWGFCGSKHSLRS